LLPDLAVRPGRPWAGTAFSAGFGAQAKTNSTPFDDTLALARGSVAHLRSALTRTFGTDRGDKKQRADKTLILRQEPAFQSFEQLATLLLGTRLPHDLATMEGRSLTLRYRTVPIRV